jgi:hypothetical protein
VLQRPSRKWRLDRPRPRIGVSHACARARGRALATPTSDANTMFVIVTIESLADAANTDFERGRSPREKLAGLGHLAEGTG